MKTLGDVTYGIIDAIIEQQDLVWGLSGLHRIAKNQDFPASPRLRVSRTNISN
jgi:hypothetical protein